MAQLIYSVLGLTIAVLFATTLNTSIFSNSQRTYTNEVLTQMLGIGEDVIEDVGRRGLPFDEAVDEERYVGQILYPLVHVAWELTPESSFGGCVVYEACLDLDDFDGMILQRTVEGLEYEAEISVAYVDELDPTVETVAQTFAKKVSVAISSTAITVGGEPLRIEYSRVFAYERSTVDTPSTLESPI
jgi:hypothetical protein